MNRPIHAIVIRMDSTYSEKVNVFLASVAGSLALDRSPGKEREARFSRIKHDGVYTILHTDKEE